MKIFSSIKKRFLTFFSFLVLTVGAIGTIGTPYTSLSHLGREEKEGTSVTENSWTESATSSAITLKSTHVTISITGSSSYSYSLNYNNSKSNVVVAASSKTNISQISGTLTMSFSSPIKMTSIGFSFGQSGLAYGAISCKINGSSVTDNSVLHYPNASTSVTDVTGSNGSGPYDTDTDFLNSATYSPNSTSARYAIAYSGYTSKTDSSYLLAGLILSVGKISVKMDKTDSALTASPSSVSVYAGKSTNVTIGSVNSRTLSISSAPSSSVATVALSGSTLKITGVGYGTTSVTIMAAESSNYNLSTVVIKITVNRNSANEPTPQTKYDQFTNTIKNLDSSASYTLTISGGGTFGVSNASTYSLQSYEGKTITQITRNARTHTSTTTYTASSQTVSYYVIPRAKTPTLSYNSVTGVLSGLTSDKTYGIVNSSGTTISLVATATTMDIASLSAFAGQTLASAYLKGTYTDTTGATAADTKSDTIDSVSSAITFSGTNKKVLTHSTLTGVSFDQQTGNLTGLTSGKSYTLTYVDSSSTEKTLTIVPTGTSYDLATLTSPSLIGGTLSKIKFVGDDSTYTDGEKTISGTILEHRDTPDATYNQDSGYLTGLVSGETYILGYTPVSGSSTTYTFTASDTSYDLSSDISKDATLNKATITSLILKGNGTTTSDSLAQTDSKISSKVIYPRQTVETSSSYDEKTGYYSSLEAGASYTFNYTTSAGTETNQTFAIEAGSTIDIATKIADTAPFTLTSIVKKGVNGTTIDSFVGPVNKTVYQHIATPELSFSSTTGYLTGLVDGASYTLTYLPAGETQEKTISIKATTTDSLYNKDKLSYDLSAVTSLLNASTIKVKRLGDYTTTCDSLDEDLLATKVLPREETSTEAFSLKKGKIKGLVDGKTYTVSYLDSSSATQSFTFVATNGTADYSSGEKSLDLAVKSAFTGAKITSIYINGDGTSSANSYLTDEKNTPVLPHETLPSASYSSATGYLTGLVANGNYLLGYTDSNGESKTYAFTPTSDSYDLAGLSSLIDGKVNYLTKYGNYSTTSDSLDESLADKTVYSREEVTTETYSLKKGKLEGLIEGESYTIGYTDKDGNTKKYTFVANSSTDKYSSSEKSLDLALITDFEGATITSLMMVGDGTSHADSYLSDEKNTPVLPHEVTPTASYSSQTGYLTGLVTGGKYVLGYSDSNGDSKTYEFSTVTTTFDIAAVSSLIGGKLNSLVKYGDYTTTSDSLEGSLANKKVVARKVTTTETTSLEKGKLEGLIEGETYTIGYLDKEGNAQTYTFVATSSTTNYSSSEKSLDLALISAFTGAKITSITLMGDGLTSADSYLTDEKKTPVLPHETTPTATYSEATGYLTGLVAGGDYVLGYTDSNGDAKTYSFSAVTDTYDIAGVDGLINGKLTSLMKVGDYTSTSDSLLEDMQAKTVYAREKTTTENYSLEKGKLEGLIEGKTYTIVYLDKDGNQKTFSFVASSSTAHYDVAEKSLDLALISEFTGAKITSVYINGDGLTATDSYLTDEKKTPVLPHETTPTTAYTSKTGYLTNLVAGEDYVLSYTTSTGETKTYTFTPTGTTYDLAEVSALTNGNITSLMKVGDYTSTSDSLLETDLTDTLIIPREVDPTPSDIAFTLTKSILSGLEEGGSYRVIFTDGSSKEFTLPTGTSSIDLALDTTLSDKVIASLTKTGDMTSTIDSHIISLTSLGSEKDRTVFPHYETPTATFVASDGYLKGLVDGASYTLAYSSITGESKTYTFVATSSKELDISFIKDLQSTTLVSLMQNNDLSSSTSTHSDSLLEESLKGLVVIPRQEVPTSTYASKYGVISGLTPDHDYIVTCSDGNSYTLTSSKDGTISLSDNEVLSKKVVTGVAIVGDPTTSDPCLTSYAQKVTDNFPDLGAVKEMIKKEALDELTDAVKGEDEKDPDNDLSEKATEIATAIEKKINDEKDTYDPSTMTIDEYKDYLTRVIRETTAEVDFEVLRTQVIEQISAKKRNCTDETLDHYIEGAITEVKNQGYSYPTREEDIASLYSIRDKSLAGISLIMAKIKGVETINQTLDTDLASSRSPIGYEEKAKELVNTYTGLINGSTSETEVTTYTNEFSTALTSLRSEYASGAHCFMHWIDLALLISYLIFAFIYGLITHHNKMDGTYAGVGILTLVLTIALSFFIYDKIDLWILLALYVTLFVLNLFLIFNKDDKKKKEPQLAYSTVNGVPVNGKALPNVVATPTPVSSSTSLEENKKEPVFSKPKKKRVTHRKKKTVVKPAAKKEAVKKISKPVAKKKATPKKKSAPKKATPVIAKPVKLTTMSHIYGKKSHKGRLR
jgi:hypothetical protein